MNRKTIRVISAALLAYFFIMMITAVFGSLAEEDVFLDAWYSMLGSIPFGNVLAPLCVDLFSDSFDLGNNMAQYVSGIKPFNQLSFFEDVITVMLAAVLYEAVNNVIQVLLHVKGSGGVYGVLMQMISGMVSVLLCTFVASVILHYLFEQLSFTPDAIQSVVSILVGSITVSGAVGIMYFVLGMGIASALLFVIVKIVLINTLKIGATYTGILLILLFLSEKAYVKVFSVFAGWGVVIVLLIGADMMLASLFES